MLKAKRGGKRKSGVTICAACGRMNSAGLVWRFAVGSEAAASVLATSVYHSLKSSKPSGISDEVAVAAENKTGASCLLFPIAGRMRRFFAPYLQRTHDRILRRVLILAALRNHRQSAAVNRWRLQDLVDPLALTINRPNCFRLQPPAAAE